MSIPQTDCLVFSAVHLAFLGFIAYAVFHNWRWDRPGKIVRGEVSQRYFYVTYGFVSVNLMQIIQVSEAFKGNKVLFSVIDLVALFYLIFFNGWFRNWLIGKLSSWKQMAE